MPTQPSTNPTEANLTGTVLDNLLAGLPLQTEISETLNTALKSQLADAAAAAKLPVLVGLINAMPAGDLVAAKDLSLQAFIQQQVDPMVDNDPVMKTAVDNEIAKLPVAGPVSSALNLTSPLVSHPLLKTIVANAQLAAVLSASPVITSAMRVHFVTLYNANQDAMPDFWTKLASDPQLGPVVPQLQLTLQLGTLTQNNPDLVAKLLAQYHPANVRDLTKLDTTQLVQFMIAENVQVPTSIAATTQSATLAQYADSIVTSLKQAFPTDYIAKSFAASTDATNQAVGTFLAKSPDFDFATTKIDTYLSGHATALSGLTTDQETAFTDRLKATQRVFRTTTDGGAIQTLIASDLDSSYKIASTPTDSFADQYAASLGGEDQANQIHANAALITAMTSNIIRQVQENAAHGMPRMLKTSKGTSGATLDAAIPDWQTLFGTTSTCQCTECRAIDGPAAYFVSLLDWLGKMGKNDDKNTPLDILIGSKYSKHGSVSQGRRPDLPNLKLNCANADTALPYVDLVNEIMESYVANKELSNLTAHDTPSDTTSEALSVNPEYLQTPDAIKAYNLLNANSIVYPLTLPFDRYLVTVRNYLTFLGVSRYELLQAFGLALPETGPASANLAQKNRLAAEALLLSESEYVLIAFQDFAGAMSVPDQNLWDYFGYTSDDQNTWQESISAGKGIAKVSNFLSRTGVAFSELVDLLNTQYLNPTHLDPTNPATAVLSTPSASADQCDVTQISILNGNLFFQALPPFLRLRQKLGWSVAELDYALRAFGIVPMTTQEAPVKVEDPTEHPLLEKSLTPQLNIDLPIPITWAFPIPANFILIAAQIKKLRVTLNLSVSQVVSLWKDIDTDGRGSKYISLFQNKAVLNPPDSDLQLVYQVPVETSSAVPPFPSQWSDMTPQTSASYIPPTSSTAGQIIFGGSMTDSQRDDLLHKWALKNDEAIMAVQLLYSQRWYNGIDVVKPVDLLIKPVHLPGTTASTGDQTPLISLDPLTPLVPSENNFVADLIGNHISVIISALKVSASDVLAIGTDAGLYTPSQGWGRLSVSNLSALYRYAILAQSLGLSVPDLITLKGLTGLQPFQIYTGADWAATDPMVQFVDAAQAVGSSQFSVAQLSYLYATTAANSLEPLQAAQDTVISTLLVGLQNIAASNVFTPDPTGAALQKKLAVLLPSTLQLNAAMNLIGGADYTSPLAALPPGITLPTGHVSFIVATATIGDSLSTYDLISVIVASSGITGSPVSLSHSVQPGDTPITVAAALAALITGNSSLVGAGISATVLGPVITFSTPAALSPSPAWTASGNFAVTFAGNLVSAGPMTDATLHSLLALAGGNQAFSSAVQNLYDQAQNALTQNLGFLAAPGPYKFSLSPLPTGLALPPSGQVSYIAATQDLICNGPMLYSTKTSLLGQSMDSAVDNLYTQAWGSATTAGSAIASLIDVSSGSTPADRYDYVLQGLFVYLTDTQSRNLVKQSLAQALSLDPSVVDLLLEGNPALNVPNGLLSSFAEPAQSAMSDFLGGLSATYTTSSKPELQIDPGVNLSATQSGFSNVQWTGKLLTPTTGSYSFAVLVNDVLMSSTIAPAQATLKIGDKNVTLIASLTAPTQATAMNLTAGQVYNISLNIPGAPAGVPIALQWCVAPAPLTTLATVPSLSFMPCAADGSYPTLSLLYRLAVLLSGFSMSPSDIAYFSTHGADFAGTDPATNNSVSFSLSSLPAAAASDGPALFNQWLRLNALYSLKASLPSGNITLFDVFASASAPSASTTAVSASVLSKITSATGWDQAEVETLSGQNGFSLSDSNFRNEVSLVRLSACISIGSGIGVSAQQLFGWANPGPAAPGQTSQFSSIAQDIQNTAKAKYEDPTWLQVGKPLNDKLRESSKDALIDYILYLLPNLIPKEAAYTTADDLYGYFLIDVEMCACMQTSRLVQASAAIQLFVQRCLLNLESVKQNNKEIGVAPSAFSAEAVTEWNQWRKNYRVWQAATEVFLYPENWIVPDLRSNQTPFFKDLVTALRQSDVTKGNVENAFLAYLQSLQQVARLEIAGLYTDKDTKITHLIGRTFTTPYVYFYRKLHNRTYVWSAWEQINADISGDTLIPVVWNGRLFLFWPIYTEVSDPTQESSPSSPITTQPASGNSPSTTNIPAPQPAAKTLQIQLAWTEYKSGTWTPKQVTVDQLIPKKSYTTPLETSSFSYNAAPGGLSQDGLVVTAYSIQYTAGDFLADAQTLTVELYNALVALNSGLTPGSISSLEAQGMIVTLVNTDYDKIATLFGKSLPAVSKLISIYGSLARGQSAVLQSMYNTFASFNPESGGSGPLAAIETLVTEAKNIVSDVGKFSPVLRHVITLLGSFSFDGSQGSVEINTTKTLNSTLADRFMSIADMYTSVSHQPSGEFSYQNIRLKNDPFKLVFSDISGSNAGPIAIFSPNNGIPSCAITIPQQNIPIYTINSEEDSFEAVAFYADRRRTYFVVESLPATPDLTKNRIAADSKDLRGAIYLFNHYHPWVGEFIKRLNLNGISYLLGPTTQALNTNFDTSFYGSHLPYVARPHPREVVDFSPWPQSAANEELSKSPGFPAGGYAYSIYNWEIFFYIPLLIATRLSQNKQFEEAQTWFHYIFNPIQPLPGTATNAYWNFTPLNQMSPDKGLDELLLSASESSPHPAFTAQFKEWQNAPFDPDIIARLRPVAYEKTVVMKYLDNLIAWGDYLFSQNTRESINESIQIYILADQILGPKPVTIPLPGTVLDQTYSELLGDKIYGLGNANVQLENAFPLIVQGTNAKKGKAPLAMTPYFCTPANNNLLAYYDTVADRLYKIRHCMNIQGQVEQLPLFGPSINPALLVAAEAAGVDLSSVLNDISAAVPHYRFTYMLSKALELCAEVRSLGAALLSALEKSDAEGLALLRARQELSVLHAVQEIKQLQIQEANDNYAGLLATQAVITARQAYYNALVQGGLSAYETAQVEAMGISEELKLIAQAGEITSGGLAVIPQLAIGINGALGSPSVIVTFGGQQTSSAASAISRAFGALADISSFVAAMSGLMGGWDRRDAEWSFQLQTANLELAQIQLQINAAQIRMQIATQDANNQNLLITNAAAVQDALKSKFTNQDLYGWMIGQVSAVFFQVYQMSYDLARRAEACYRFELGIPQSSYIQFGYWDSLKQGLLSGEKLFQDLKRLENAYLDQNKREYEISKNISLLLLDPVALISLRLTGTCVITLPEAFFDMDYPGHYMRRLKSVSLTIPCVTGPYTSVNCTLTLLQSKIRWNNANGSYGEQPVGSDLRFFYSFSATESIATSTAQSDSGMFEVNFRDERYLPFEGSGAVSQWQLSMPPDCNSFDFESITDVILNLRYTARNGGDSLRKAAKAAAVFPVLPVQPAAQLSSSKFPAQNNLVRSFSLRHEYPTEWYKLLNPPAAAASTAETPASSMQINLGNDRFGFQYRWATINITQAQLVVLFNNPTASTPPALQTGFMLTVPGSSAPPPVPVPFQFVQTQNLGNTLSFSTVNAPPVRVPSSQAGPDCWILQYFGKPTDLSQTQIADIFLLCQFSATPKSTI